MPRCSLTSFFIVITAGNMVTVTRFSISAVGHEAVALHADLHINMMQERRWFFIRNGKSADYHGPAVHWRHLSRWERHICKYHLQYDPVADLQQRRDAKLAGNAYNPSQPLMNGKAPHPQNGTAV